MRAQEVAYRFSVHVCGHVDEAEDVMQRGAAQDVPSRPAHP